MNNNNKYSKENLIKRIEKDDYLRNYLYKIGYSFENIKYDEQLWHFKHFMFEGYFKSLDNLCKLKDPFSKCKQSWQGERASITYYQGQLTEAHIPCNCRWKEIIKNNYLYFDFDFNDLFLFLDPKELKDVIMKQKSFFEIYNIFKLFLDKIDKEYTFTPGKNYLFQKGIYLYGESGIGKTFLLKKFANFLALKGTVTFISTSTLIKLSKKYFNDMQKNKDIVSLCEKANYLFLDDIGNENITKWIRDDLLFPILDYRYAHNKYTFFSSNFSIKELQKRYTKIYDVNLKYLNKTRISKDDINAAFNETQQEKAKKALKLINRITNTAIIFNLKK